MRISFVGLPYFGKKLAKDLEENFPMHSFSFYNTYYSKLDQIKFIATLPFADLVISMNGVSSESGSLNFVLKMKKKLWLQWQGTDVLLALERSKSNTIFTKYIKYATNYTDAPWLADELNSVGIDTDIISFKWLNISHSFASFPKLGVYSYVPKGKEVFYGWEIIFELAHRNPHIPFYIAGTDGEGLTSLENIKFLGWINKEEMNKMQASTPIFLRLPAHDGYSLTVLEALLQGSEVIWSSEHEKCHFLHDIEQAETVFKEVIAIVEKRHLNRNIDNINFVNEHFSKQKILNDFLKKIEEVVTK